MAGYFVGLRNLISSIIYRPLDWLFRYFLGIEVGRRNIENENLLRVQIKTMNNRTIPLCLRQEWTIRKVKEQLAQILDINDPESLGILFCGREISNDVLISTCDLGQHSVLHAVQIVQKVDSKPPLNEELVDLQITGAEREKEISKKANFWVYCKTCSAHLQVNS